MSKTAKKDYSAFIAKAKEEAKKKSFEMPIDSEIAGIFEGLEFSESKKGKKVLENSFISLTLFDKPDILVKYWSFGLLNHLIKGNKVKKGDMIYFKKTPKSKKGFWGCEFYFERA